MNVYFDTEFSSIEMKSGHRHLISIGCAAQDGREFYAELTDTWDKSRCSAFTIEHVLPLLQGGDCAMEKQELAVRLSAWIKSLTDAQVAFFSDAPNCDWPFLQEIFEAYGWPANLRQQCRNACVFESDSSRFRYNAAIADFWRTSKAAGAREHHALWDARSIRFARRYALRRKP